MDCFKTILAGLLVGLFWGMGVNSILAENEDLVRTPLGEVIQEAGNSYIFVFDSAFVPENEVSDHAIGLTNQFGGVLRHTFTAALRGFSANIPEHAAARLAEKNPLILYYEPNGIAWIVNKRTSIQGKPDSPPGKNKDGGGDGGDGDPEPPPPESAQVTPFGISRVGGPVPGNGLQAWVLDTGIDLDHPDLVVNSKKGKNFVASLFKGKRGPGDGNGHGTHVAGTIGAIDNSIDVVGVAAGATLIPIRVLGDSGNGTIDNLIAGIDYVAQNANSGDCANISIQTTASQALNDAVENASQYNGKDIFFTIAAGNSSNSAMDISPASADGPNIFTVSAVDDLDVFASFSNYGNPPVDFAAPGVKVLSTKNGGGVETKSGTSMASPHVCGLLLLNHGVMQSDGTAINDPDGSPDPIAVY
jgi:hypothetical protein